jgi:hypothetical protein
VGRRAIVAVVVVAAALRVLHVLSIREAYFFDHLQTERLRYVTWAAAIATGHGPAPPFDEPPGYPYFLAAVFRTAGASPTAIALVQVALDTVTCALVALLARRWFGDAAGVVAGAIAAAYRPLVYFAGTIEPATTSVCALTAAIAAAAGRRWLVAGVLWSVAFLFRAEALLGLPLALVAAARRDGRRAAATAAAPVAVLLVALAAVNVAHTGKLVVYITSGGLNFWAGNSPDADGVSPFFSGPRETVLRDVAARAHDAADADRLFLGRALAFWRDEPGRAVGLAWKKLLWTLGDRELPNTGDIAWEERQSALVRSGLVPLGFGFVLPLALLGAVRLGRRWRAVPLLAAPIAVGLVTPVVFFTNARLRLAMVPSLAILAGFAVADVVEVTRRRAWRPADVAVAIATIAAGVVVAWGGFYGEATYRIPEITVNTGILEREAGRLPEAVRLLRDGLRDAPDDALAWRHLGLALDALGDRRAALDAYLAGLARRPDDLALRTAALAFCRKAAIDPALLQRFLAAPPGPERDAAGRDIAARVP